jgi:hypothetical protein
MARGVFQRPAPADIDDARRVARFTRSLLLAGAILFVSGIAYVGWFVLGSS